jgi:predicted ATPase/DNA-binding winged helix-turn-helix (wHTH) protein
VNASRLRFGRLEIRPRERRLLLDDREVPVGARAFDLLLVLVEERERLVPKQELLERVWPKLVVEEANLSVHVAALRKALGTDIIATIPGRGYRFALAEETDPAAEAMSALSAADAVARSAAVASEPRSGAGHGYVAAGDALFVGREDEVYDIVALLAERRLVSIVGEGGIGKTRLARAVWQRVREDFVDGAWWVDLATATRSEEVAGAIARALGVVLPEHEPARGLAASLALRARMLVVLDNCEQAASPTAAVVAELLASLPALRLLGTSRVPLHVSGEQVWRIESLAVPAPDATAVEARRSGAFELFEARAHATDQRFHIHDSQLPLAIEVCRRLEGHPLAIEMAAARAPYLGLPALVQRLDQRLRLLRTGDPTGDDRQSSIRKVLEWSASLLDPMAAAVLRRISVFAGSFDLVAAQAVAAASDADEWDVIDGLATLVDHSMVKVAGAGDTEAIAPAVLRYRLGATTRLFAAELLERSGEVDATQWRHALAMTAVARRIVGLRWTPHEHTITNAFAADHEDLRTAHDLACRRGDAGVSAWLGRALDDLEGTFGPATGERRRCDAVSALLSRAPDPIASALLWDQLCTVEDRHERVETLKQRVAAWRACGDLQGLLQALCDLARELAAQGSADKAKQVLSKAKLATRSDASADWQLEIGYAAAAVAAFDPSVCTEATSALELLLNDESICDPYRKALGLWQLAELSMSTPETPAREALSRCEAAVAALGSWPRSRGLAMAWRACCFARLRCGDRLGARAAAAEAWPRLSNDAHAPTLFDALAVVAVTEGDIEHAARLLNMADRWYEVHRRRSTIESEIRSLAEDSIKDAVKDWSGQQALRAKCSVETAAPSRPNTRIEKMLGLGGA